MRSSPCEVLRNLALALALAAAGVSLAQAADKVDVTGTWEVEIEIAGQQGMPTFELKQEGNEFIGIYKGNFGEQEVTGTVDGDKVEFSFEIQDGAVATYTGTIDGDTMKGEANYADQASGEWTAKRKKKKK